MLEKAVTNGYIINTQIVVRRDHVFANFIKYFLNPQNSNVNLLPFHKKSTINHTNPIFTENKILQK